MAATATWKEDNGAQAGSPLKGTTRTTVANDNTGRLYWKNADDTGTTAYTASPITAGNRSFDKHQFVEFGGTYNQILNGKWAHTAGTLTDTTNSTIWGKVAATYRTPATTSNAALDQNMNSVTAIGSGLTVQFGATGPEAAGKAASTTSNPAFTEWLTTQLATTASLAPGNIASSDLTFTLQWDEN
jgi:hypothetical protein